jgi:Ycf66 protein N-terminus
VLLHLLWWQYYWQAVWASFCYSIFQMLPYILAILVGTGSVGIYLAAFWLPEIYRRSDPIWSGVGLFYALVLWVEADRLTGGLLLGQALSVLLLGWFAWQSFGLRRLALLPEERTPWPETLEKLWAASFIEQSPETAWIEIRQEFPPDPLAQAENLPPPENSSPEFK